MRMTLFYSVNRQPKVLIPVMWSLVASVCQRSLAIAILVSLATILAGCHSNRRESFYHSLADAKRDGAIDRGWIPDFLPESSRAIHELHDISPSVTWCAFEFVPTDSAALKKRVGDNRGSLRSVRHVPEPDRSWWPAALVGDLDMPKIHSAGLDLYELVEPETASNNEVLLFTIDWAKGRGFFYRTPIS
jgi:hypothetical protein